MEWKHVLAYITGSVDQELLVRNEYLVTENRILRQQIVGRIRLSSGERKTLAAIGKKLGRQALADVASIVKPETILAWHRMLVAKKCEGSPQRKTLGRPHRCRAGGAGGTAGPGELFLGVRLHRRGPPTRGYTISDQTAGNILKRHGIPPAPKRKKTMTWQEFIRTHMGVLVATDFFTTEVWTWAGLVTYYVLFFIHLASRKIHVAGVTPHPDQCWMT